MTRRSCNPKPSANTEDKKAKIENCMAIEQFGFIPGRKYNLRQGAEHVLNGRSLAIVVGKHCSYQLIFLHEKHLRHNSWRTLTRLPFMKNNEEGEEWQ